MLTSWIKMVNITHAEPLPDSMNSGSLLACWYFTAVLKAANMAVNLYWNNPTIFSLFLGPCCYFQTACNKPTYALSCIFKVVVRAFEQMLLLFLNERVFIMSWVLTGLGILASWCITVLGMHQSNLTAEEMKWKTEVIWGVFNMVWSVSVSRRLSS